MNMLTPHRRSGRRRQAPKRFEDEKFVSGRVDQYTRNYDGWVPKKCNRAQQEDAENYYHNRKGRKFISASWNRESGYRLQLRDFPESLLELTSIWRDFNRELPGDVLDHIGTFLNFTQLDQALLVDDDGFVAADDSESEYESDDQDKKKWSCSALPMDDEEWSSGVDTDESDYDSDELYDSD
jgi:hypothetical protein